MTALRLIAGLFLVLSGLSAAAQPENLRQAEDAFRLSVERTDGAIELRWKIEDGYYLYRDHLQAKNPATGEAVELRTEPGIVEAGDASFGPSEVYYRETAARLGADAPEKVAVTYQGCKKDSICWSAPMKWSGFSLNA